MAYENDSQAEVESIYFDKLSIYNKEKFEKNKTTAYVSSRIGSYWQRGQSSLA